MVRRCTKPSIHFFVSRSQSVVDCANIQAFMLKLSRSRSLVRRAHIQAFTLLWNSQDHGLTSTYPSIRNQNLHTCWLWTRPPVLSPVPSQAIQSRACSNLHLCDIQSTAQKSPCVNTFLRPSSKKKKTFLSLSRSLSRIHRTKTTDT